MSTKMKKLQAIYNDLLALQGQTDQVPLSKALDAIGFALAVLDEQDIPQVFRRPANINECPSCKRISGDGVPCSRGGCPMGWDL